MALQFATPGAHDPIRTLGHHLRIGHCDFGCCQDAVGGFWRHAQLARYGCPDRAYDNYGREAWTGRPDGGGGCTPERVGFTAHHCALLKLDHAWRYTVEYLNPACTVFRHDFPYTGRKVTPDAAGWSCTFPS